MKRIHFLMSLAAWATLSMCLAPHALAQNPSGGGYYL